MIKNAFKAGLKSALKEIYVLFPWVSTEESLVYLYHTIEVLKFAT